ncbi:hypothetical protein [Chitinimonas koreensis]|uniref:hypothetical protein n=1 Tax=Chitinimonas koreensis TaxID=356302 RepID=UPI0012FC2936|nr:hypothetical protein [Chitinimonas koreensis]QNM95477.1 hypothetical protein H9L41_16620 [Chitinimonas koreensis]
MSQHVIAFPVSGMKCPPGDMAFHQVHGFVTVTEVRGAHRLVKWDEPIDEAPDDEESWLKSSAGTTHVSREVEVPLNQLEMIEGRAGAADGCNVVALKR